MAELKTRATEASVGEFIAAVDHPVRREDAKTLLAMMGRVTGKKPRMWGPSIIGFGSYSYRYDSGHGGTMCRIGFSPRKAQLVLYVLTGYMGGNAEQERLLEQLGKHKVGKSCLYINKLADVDLDVLEKLCASGWADMNRRFPDEGEETGRGDENGG